MNYLSEISPGTLVDRRYEIVKTLGQGGFGRTYLVKDERKFDRYFVLKEFLPQATNEYAVTKSRELFEREAKVLNELKHPQIPEFYGWFKEDERLYLVQQFVDGKTYANILWERQQRDRAFNEPEVIQLLKDLLPVLHYIHDNYVIHRDISPDNIMLCRKAEKPILIDFGVVDQQTATQIASGAIKAGGTTVGKRSYSPAEQITAGICYPNSDLYALAITALNLLTGKPPVELRDNYSDSWQWRNYVQVSDRFGKIIDKMLSPIPKDRYQSASEVLDELNKLSSGIPTVIIPEDPNHPNNQPAPPKTASKSRWILGGVSAIAAVIGLLFWQSPKIGGMCDALNNCSVDREYEAQYQEIVEQVEPVLAEAANDNNLATYSWARLENLRVQLQQTAGDLRAIPTDINIADEVEQTLTDVMIQIKRIEKEQEPTVTDESKPKISPGPLFINPDRNN